MPMRVDIVSDVVCPWCIVGYRQLQHALDDRGLTADIAWHPFELNPQMPPEGQNLREHIKEKYGTSDADSDRARARLTQLGESLGFPFRYTDGSRMVNTFQAHQLLHWAGEHGRQHDLKLALFTAYFTDGRDVSDPAVLVAVAGSLGLDPAEAQAVLTDGRYAASVREEERFWVSNGIQGVPAMVFQRRHLVTGAQGVETYGAIIDQLAAQTAA